MPHPRPGQHRHHRRPRVRRHRHPRRARPRGEDRRGRVHGDRAVRRCRVLRLVPHRDVEGLRRATPTTEVTGNPSDDYERRAPGLGGMWEGVRYQYYEASDGHILFMASEQAFWKNFCEGVDRMDLFEKWPGKTHRRPRPRQQRAPGDPARHLPHAHDPGVDRLRRRAQHDDRAGEHPADGARTTRSSRTGSAWTSSDQAGADMLLFPLHVEGEELPVPDQGAGGGRAHRRRCCATCSATTTPRSRRCATPAHWAEPMSTQRSGPLRGIRVLDFSIALTGPYAAALLADQGADVVKVERPGIGDIGRWVGVAVNGMSALYFMCNRGKRSIAVDLHQPEGVEIALRARGGVRRDRRELPARRDGQARPRLRRRARRATPTSCTRRSPASGPRARTATAARTTP